MKKYLFRNLLRKMLSRKIKRFITRILTNFIVTGKVITVEDGRKFFSIKERVFWRVYYEKQYEPEIQNFVAVYLKPRDKVIDVGANFGWYTTLFALHSPLGHVYAFEPIPGTFDVLKKNLELNSMHNTTIHMACVGDLTRRVQMRFSTRESGLAHVSANRSADGAPDTGFILSDMVSLDAVLGNMANEISLIKIDVEGAEELVLLGAKNLLSSKNPPTLLLEINDENLQRNSSSRSRLLVILKEIGYTFAIWNSKKQKLLPTRALEDHDVICLPPGRYSTRLSLKN